MAAFGSLMIRRARHMALSWLIVKAVPALNVFRKGMPWATEFDSLCEMPGASWGYALSGFLRERGLRFLPKYEQHDALHVLLGYGTTALEELRLQAFMLGNGSATFAGRALYYLGACLLYDDYRVLSRDRARGAHCSRIDWHKIERELPRSLCEVRRDWNIAPMGSVRD